DAAARARPVARDRDRPAQAPARTVVHDPALEDVLAARVAGGAVEMPVEPDRDRAAVLRDGAEVRAVRAGHPGLEADPRDRRVGREELDHSLPEMTLSLGLLRKELPVGVAPVLPVDVLLVG